MGKPRTQIHRRWKRFQRETEAFRERGARPSIPWPSRGVVSERRRRSMPTRVSLRTVTSDTVCALSFGTGRRAADCPPRWKPSRSDASCLARGWQLSPLPSSACQIFPERRITWHCRMAVALLGSIAATAFCIFVGARDAKAAGPYMNPSVTSSNITFVGDGFTPGGDVWVGLSVNSNATVHMEYNGNSVGFRRCDRTICRQRVRVRAIPIRHGPSIGAADKGLTSPSFLRSVSARSQGPQPSAVPRLT